jgi:iron complex outermembrane recepter protein
MPYRRRALSIGISVFLSAVAAGAYAQDATSQAAASAAPAASPAAVTVAQATPAPAAPPTPAPITDQSQQLETVTVTGIRYSLKKSLERKRDSDDVTEVITAEDIGKLPATNTAEALAQIPGITIDRQFSATQRVSIDGADPSLNLSFLDGHPVSQAIWLYEDSPNRGFNFSLLPPEILGSVEIYKTPEARLIEGSLGGTIIMHTVQPLDIPANTLQGSVGYNYNDLAGNGRPNASVFYSWKDPSKRIGFDVSLQHYEQLNDRQGREVFGYTPLSAVAANSTYVKNAIAAGTLKGTDLMPQEVNAAYFTQTEKRDSITSNIQFKPLSNLELGTGLLWMQDHLDSLNQSMYAFMLQNANYESGIDNLVEGTNGVIVGGHTSGTCNPNATSCTATASVILDNQARGALITTQGFDLHGTYHGDSWKLYSQVGLSNSHNVITQAFIEPAYTGGYTWDLGRGFNFDDPSGASNPANWQAQGGFFGNYASEPYSARDMFGQVDFTKDFDGIFNQLLVGFRYAIHHEGQILDVYTGAKGTGDGPGGVATLADVGAGPLTNLSGLDSMNFLSGSVNHVQPGSREAVYNWVLSTPGLFNNFYYPFFYENTFLVSQATEAGYAQLNFSQDKLRGNVGVRVVRTDTNSSSYQLGDASPSIPNAGPYVTAEKVHIDPLPALNLSYDMTQHTVLRGSLAEVIAYAPYNQLAPYVFTNDTVLTGTGGNSNLNPYRSVNLNLAAEWYFAPESLLSAGFFHKQIINYIVNGTDTEHLFNSLFITSPTQYAALQATPGDNCDNNGFCDYGVSRPQNGGRASVNGFLLSFQEPFPDSGFGVRGNFTYSGGTTHTGGDLPYNSKDAISITPYFEKGPLGASVSYGWRSKYLAGGYVAGAPSTYTSAYTELDATLSYQITKQVSISVDGLNLLDSTYSQYLGDPKLPSAEYKNGRQFLATLHLKL